jgi:predicted porin
METFLMKKTLIAAGIAAVMSVPAMADVSVSGRVKYTITAADAFGSTADVTGGSFDNELHFKASEDLGNGLSAFAQLTLDTDNANGVADEKDAKLGLKGSFGTVVVGRMETLTEGVASAKMDDGRSTHSLTVQNLESVLTGVSRVNAIAYISPTVNGFHVAAATTQVATAGNDSWGTDVDLLAAYDNGPLSLMATYADLKSDGATALDHEVTTLTGSYAMGDAKITVQRVNDDRAAADYTDMIYRLDYKMGNNSLLIGMKNADTDLANNVDVKEVKLTHSLSKRTKAYVGVRKVDSASTVDSDDVYVGMLHTF